MQFESHYSARSSEQRLRKARYVVCCPDTEEILGKQPSQWLLGHLCLSAFESKLKEDVYRAPEIICPEVTAYA